MQTFAKTIKSIAHIVEADPVDMVSFLTKRFTVRGNAADEMEDAATFLFDSAKETGNERAAHCLSVAASRLGMEMARQIEQYGFYSRDGFFDYYFAGLATEGAAIFKRRRSLGFDRTSGEDVRDD